MFKYGLKDSFQTDLNLNSQNIDYFYNFLSLDRDFNLIKYFNSSKYLITSLLYMHNDVSVSETDFNYFNDLLTFFHPVISQPLIYTCLVDEEKFTIVNKCRTKDNVNPAKTTFKELQDIIVQFKQKSFYENSFAVEMNQILDTFSKKITRFK